MTIRQDCQRWIPQFLGWILPAVLLSLAAVLPAAAQPPEPGDFAYGLRLHVSGQDPIYRVALPAAVYRGVTRSDLGDLRVFNAAGRAVPHRVRRPPGPESAEAARSVPFFPLFQNEAEGDGLMLQITTDAQGAVVRTRPQPDSNGDSRIAAYLLDLGPEPEERTVSALKLDWSGGAEGFVAEISVDASDDLNRWRRGIVAGTVARLQYAGHRLERNTIPLSRPPERYLRLSWPAETGGAELVSVQVETAAPERADRREASVRGVPDETDPGVWRFDLGGPFPADRVRLELAETNALVRGDLRSRPNPASDWRYRARGLFFRLLLGGEPVTGDPISLDRTVADRYWRFEPAEAGGTDVAPALVLGFVPHELLFLARGEGPFLLAFGAAEVPPAEQAVDELVRTLEQTGGGATTALEAEIGEAVTLRGPEALEPPQDYRRVLLWTVLVAGVGLIGLMVLRLWSRMSSEAKSQDNADDPKEES
ncbi:MAG: DUF3999 domain-containing protein [Thermodesulfobacteriota bacterium]